MLFFLFWIYNHHGINGLLAFFVPMYFTQDAEFQNHGHDLITFKSTGKDYFRGTWKSLSRS